MKFKVLIPIFCAIFIGFLLGRTIFKQYDLRTVTTFEEGEKIYFVQLDSFSTEESMKGSIKNIDTLLYLYEDGIYYVYGGITKNKEIANRIKEFYKDTYNNIVVQEKSINNEAFLNILTEYDKITLIATVDKDLISIEQIVISNYKEMVE